MRKVEIDMNRAIRRALQTTGAVRAKVGPNTAVVAHACADAGAREVSVLLHGYPIAIVAPAASGVRLSLSFCGWPTRTTASRLNAILDGFGNGRIGFRDWTPYLFKGDQKTELPTSGRFAV